MIVNPLFLNVQEKYLKGTSDVDFRSEKITSNPCLVICIMKERLHAIWSHMKIMCIFASAALKKMAGLLWKEAYEFK